MKIKVDKILMVKENPINNVSYFVGHGENGRYFFGWDSNIPEEVSSDEFGASKFGIIWFATEKAALAAMQHTINKTFIL